MRNVFDGLNQYIEDAKEWNTNKVNIPLSLLEAMLSEHAKLRDIHAEYLLLLASMARRDPNLDPIWMEQYAEARLDALADIQTTG